MYTFGKHGESQLERSAEGEGGGAGKGQEAEVWHLSPGLIPSLGDSCKVVWLGARSNQIFVAVNESLVSNHNLRKCGVLIILLTRIPVVCSTSGTVTYKVHVHVQR